MYTPEKYILTVTESDGYNSRDSVYRANTFAELDAAKAKHVVGRRRDGVALEATYVLCEVIDYGELQTAFVSRKPTLEHRLPKEPQLLTESGEATRSE